MRFHLLSFIPIHCPSMASDGPAPPPDALFSMDWVEKTVAPSGRGGNQIVSAPKDFYTLDSPGFIFSVPAVVIEEMFARTIFGLPANMKVAKQQIVNCSNSVRTYEVLESDCSLILLPLPRGLLYTGEHPSSSSMRTAQWSWEYSKKQWVPICWTPLMQARFTANCRCSYASQ